MSKQQSQSKQAHKPMPGLDQLMKEEQSIEAQALTVENLKKVLGKSSDVVFREIQTGQNGGISVTMLFIDGMVSSTSISEYILKPLVAEHRLADAKSAKEMINTLEQGAMYFASQEKRTALKDVILDVMAGGTALIFNSEGVAFTLDTKGFEKRSISEPTNENVIKGAKDAFVETLRMNTASVRRHLKTENVIIEETTVGVQSLTTVAIVYMEHVTNRHIIEEVKNRLNSIQIDAVASTGYIEEFLDDNNNSPFPLTMTTERVDKLCANVVEGRVGLIIDGIPVAYIVPATFNQFMQTPEDYSQNYIIASLINVLRYAMFFTALFLPGYYIAVTTFHQEMIPTELALSIEASKQGVPYPSFVEVMLLLIAFEVLVEAGIRLPKTIGQTVSVVGALIVGQAAVEAKFLSPAVVVVIAITAIASFVLPSQDLSQAVRLWRFILTIFSSIIGLFGLSIGALLLLHHLAKQETFGVPYLAPYVGTDHRQLQDTILRFPIKFFKKRPIHLKTTNKQRQTLK